MDIASILSVTLTLVLMAVLVILIRSLTRIFERLCTFNGNGGKVAEADPEAVQEVLDRVIKKAEERYRKEGKRTIQELVARGEIKDLTDEELEELINNPPAGAAEQ